MTKLVTSIVPIYKKVEKYMEVAQVIGLVSAFVLVRLLVPDRGVFH